MAPPEDNLAERVAVLEEGKRAHELDIQSLAKTGDLTRRGLDCLGRDVAAIRAQIGSLKWFVAVAVAIAAAIGSLVTRWA